MDHDALNFAVVDIREQALQRWTISISARESAIVVLLGRQLPAFVLHRRHVGLTGLALRVKRVEFLVEAMVGAFPRVDRAPHHQLLRVLSWLPHDAAAVVKLKKW